MKSKLPQADRDIEASLLGILLLAFKQDILHEITEHIGVSDFYVTSHGHIFQGILDLVDRGEAVDILLIAEELKKKNILENCGGIAYLAKLVASPPNTAHYKEYTQIVKHYALRRAMEDFGSKVQLDAIDTSLDVESIIEKAEQGVFKLNQRLNGASTYEDSASLIKRFIKKIEERKNSKEIYTGIPTGFTELDHLMSGLQDSEMIVIGARPSIGKTALALSILDTIAVKKNIPCAFFSLEMPELHLVERMIAGQARLNSNKLRNPSTLSSSDWQSLHDAASRITDAPIYFDGTPNISLMQLRSKARRIKAKHDIKVLFIDYLGLITVDMDSKVPRFEQMAMVSRSIKALARELNIPVVILSQLRRDAEGKEPNLADLRETGSIEQDADVVMFLHRERQSDSNELSAWPTKLILAKQRNGPTGVVHLAFIPKCARYENLQKELGSENGKV